MVNERSLVNGFLPSLFLPAGKLAKNVSDNILVIRNTLYLRRVTCSETRNHDLPRSAAFRGGISIVKLHSIFGAFFAAADNVESSFLIKNPGASRL